MSLHNILAENMLRFGVKNLNENELILLQNKSKKDFYSDYTYINEYGELVESTNLKLLLEKPTDPPTPDPDQTLDADQSTVYGQRGLRRLKSRVRRKIQSMPLMVKWAQWRTKRWLKKKGLPSRAELEAKDTDEVKNTGGYKEVLDLMYAKRTRDEGTIMYWYGAEVLGGEADPAAENQMSTVIQTLSAINNLPIQSTTAEPYTLNISSFIEKLQEMQKQNIFLSGEDLMEIFSDDASSALNWLFTAVATGKDPNGVTYTIDDTFLTKLAAEYNKMGDEENPDPNLFYNDMKRDLARLQNFATKLVLGAAGAGGEEGGSSTYSVEMTPQDKIDMLPRIIEQHRKNVEEVPSLTWQDYTSFYIAPGAAEIKANLLKVQKKQADGSQIEAYASYYSYPDNPNDPASQNVIYGNLDDETTWSDTTAFEAEMKRRIDAIVNNGGEIYRIEYNAGARSSAVGTMKYSKSAKPSSAEKTQGNIQLCKDRATGITTAMKPVIDKLLPALAEGAKELKTPNLHPNRGPGWYEYDPVGTADASGKTYGNGYGPLYNKYYKGFKQEEKDDNVDKVTPRYFYAGRNNSTAYDAFKLTFGYRYPDEPVPTQAMLQQEYETIFGPHRGTYAGYVLFYTKKPEIPPTPPTEEIDAKIETAGKWFFSLDYTYVSFGDFKYSIKSRWKRFKRKIKRFKLPRLGLLSGGGVAENLVHICDAYN